MTMAADVPAIVTHRIGAKARSMLDLVKTFVEEECIPADSVYFAQLGHGEHRWLTYPPIIDRLKTRAKELGLWNLFLSKTCLEGGAGFSNLEYALMAEHLGKSRVAPEATNTAAPDSGNMDLLLKYGDERQKRQWLDPLLKGDIRSAFLMTEPDIASSDATNIRMTMKREGDEYVLNGAKWWSSGAGDPRCKIYIVLGKTDPQNPTVFRQQSVILVPASTRGVTIRRMLSVYGYDDAPHGHGQIMFENVRVPASNIVLGEGRGFEVVQGRLGPGRLHHAARAVGAAERALDWMLARVNDDRRKTFGKLLKEHGVVTEWIGRSRMEIDAARLIVLSAAIKIDDLSVKNAVKEIAEAKVFVPNIVLGVIDRAVQSWGAAGVSQDTPLASMWAHMRTLKIADGPDEIHLQHLARNENRRADKLLETMARQGQTAKAMLKEHCKPEISRL